MTDLLSHRYRILTTLGDGGFGQTFLAEDTQIPSQRRCVIKQLKPVTDRPELYQLVKERFQREAAILESLGEGSSQIPKLYAYFEAAGLFYLVQEWVDGITLTQKIQQQGQGNEAEVRELLTSLLPVLNYIHGKGIIHRDIKPDNIILRHADRQPVLIDFGAVKETVQTVLNTQGQPTRSIVIGTPGYMPPEQAIGKPVFSSDLYSLGLTAIYWLTGRSPYELETNPQTGEFIWQPFVPHLTPNLIAVLERTIQSHIRDRFATAQDMLIALQSAGGIHIPPPTIVQPRPTAPPYSSQPASSPPYSSPSHPSSPYPSQPPPYLHPQQVPPPTIASSQSSSQSTPSAPSDFSQSGTQGTGAQGAGIQGRGTQRNSFVFGGAIAGGLIGAAIIVGMLVTRSNQLPDTALPEPQLPETALPNTPISVPSPNFPSANDEPPSQSGGIATASLIDWTTTAATHRGQLNQEFSYLCPPNGQIHTVWGSVIYTDDSSICTAAVHAGLITVADGGVVSIRILPGQSSYPSSTWNGVTTGQWNQWHGSFEFVN